LGGMKLILCAAGRVLDHTKRRSLLAPEGRLSSCEGEQILWRVGQGGKELESQLVKSSLLPGKENAEYIQLGESSNSRSERTPEYQIKKELGESLRFLLGKDNHFPPSWSF